MEKYSKNFFLGTLVISLITLVGCSGKVNSGNLSASKVKTPIVIKFGYQPGHAQIVVARDKGWLKDEFEKDGITFEFEKFVSGPPLIEAMTGGRLDFGQVGDQPAIQAKANNVDIKAIAVYNSTEKGNALLATSKSGINSLADLKGKKVGVTIGSVGQQLLYIYLKSVGLKITDIQQVNLQPGDIKSSLASNSIDAAVTWEPNITQIVNSGSAKIVTDGTGYKNNVNVIIAKNSFLKEHPDVTVRLLKVLDKSARWIKDNKKEAVDIVSKDTGISPSALEPIFDKNILDINFTDEEVKSVDDTTKFLKENNVIRKDVKVTDLIDRSYLKKAGIK
ncbi:ABC transporter substrate-binding protein [Clostridium pasteurianum]|uniref:ABC transporter, substrate-binding protein, aliphatic sulfonates family n=1 Tax=Clostridium pasteurianum BC1 TaxID=86416 RepID=R4KE88_CLOPA|nr:aliphatic sulfonate ABC transporter substrate-binding protein [Clostridium pasteurianum]AGK98874.1 ABC transporter, substrate-binding protein, aliphatic sulfonates family [Clostridium pasteurianum BC1]